MTDTATASDLMTEVRQHTDTVGDANIPDAFLLTLIDKSYGKLYRQISTQYQGFFEAEDTSITLVVDQRLYALPADFFHLKGVDLVLSSGDRVTLYPASFGERNDISNDPRLAPRLPARLKSNYRYMLQGNNLRISPKPNSTEQLILTYVPRPTRITNSGDTFDVIAGFDSFIVYDAAIAVLAKQERDPSAMIQLRQDALQDVVNSVTPRITGDSVQVRDDFFGNDGVGGWL